MEEVFPGELGFGGILVEINDFPAAIGADAEGDQDGPFLSAQAGLSFQDDAVEDEDFIIVGEIPLVVRMDGSIELLGHPADRGGAHPLS